MFNKLDPDKYNMANQYNLIVYNDPSKSVT